MKKRNEEPETVEENVTRGDQEEESYLSSLASSVLKKGAFPYKDRVQGRDRRKVTPQELEERYSSAKRREREDQHQAPHDAPEDLRQAAGRRLNPQRQAPKPSARSAAPEPMAGLAPPSAQRPPAPPSQPQTKGQPASRQPSTPTQTSPRTPQPKRDEEPHETPSTVDEWTEESFAPGDIIILEDKTIGVFKEEQTGKEYHVVYVLMPDGSVKAQGLALYSYDVVIIGTLPTEFLLRLQRRMRWDRDEIIYHLDDFDFCRLVPRPEEPRGKVTRPAARRPATRPDTAGGTKVSSPEEDPLEAEDDPTDLLLDQDEDMRELEAMVEKAASEPPIKPPPAPEKPRQPEKTPEKPKDKPKEEEAKPAFTRGRRLKIKFGPNQAWDAMYWGKDELGHVVAHNTHNEWSLMHLDLERFKTSMEIGDIADKATLDSIHQELVKSNA